MKAWIQRVSRAAVETDGEEIARIGKGFLVLLGVTHSDTALLAAKMAEKIATIRLFEDDSSRMNRSLDDVGGEVIVVSQFTLYADTAHGRRPGFSAAAPGIIAEDLYGRVVEELRGRLGRERVQTGRFGADMKVALVNDGPVSVEILLQNGEGRHSS